jgi:enediyne biosynthesis protein E4
MKQLTLIVLTAILLSGCKDDQNSNKLFRKVDKDEHGISFQNTIYESDSLNILTLEYIYNGGGVGVADFNNDGLSDLFFTGNMVENKLYLNKGNLKFEDISVKAGIGAKGRWKSSVAIADVNGDGLKDIYVCATIKQDSLLRQNMLFINKGNNDEGVPTFEDQAAAYRLNYAGHSSGAAFLDFDNDNDLDLYVMTNNIVKEIPTSYREKLNDGTYNADVLLRNNGDGTFTDISKEAGIVHEGYGLGIAIADINMDGWQDIYVSNDYITNDLLYINNKNGTFTNMIDECIKHQSQFSMGNDVSDFNNDGYPDVVTLDMLPEGNLRRKTVISGNNYSTYINNLKYGYSHQYVRNMLQLNNGDGTFSEIGQLAGVHQTEWSWSPLFMDVDNDGLKDLFITNGFPRDITDKDFANFRAETNSIASVAYQIDSIPVVKISNYAFKNNGDLTFKDMTSAWGMNIPSFSNGASFADLDNDGDLDYVVNNINEEVFLYENNLYNDEKAKASHYLRVRLEGAGKNRDALGAKLRLYCNTKLQYHDHSVIRGYISSVEDVVHFGVDTITTIDSLVCEWPDGKRNVVASLKADQLITLKYIDAKERSGNGKTHASPLMTDITINSGVKYVHNESDKIDFNVQRTIPHKFSQSGPGIAVGDVNADGLDDFYVGGSANNNGSLFIQTKAGSFTSKEIIKSQTRKEEDQGALFFDADNDKDLDLYVVSGTFEWEAGSENHQDRLYINDGKGNFQLKPALLPDTKSSGSCVRAADIDSDGDMDLFVGGEVIPGQYPYAAESYVLINEGGKFLNKTKEWNETLQFVGIVNDALFTDVDLDGKLDLLIAGELMPIMILKNTGSKFERLSNTGLEKYSGWWNSITGADFDRDGDTDFVAGNLGLNNYYKASEETPLRVYAKDVDGNNSVDAILSCYLKAEDGTMKEFPVHFWEELNSQSPKFRRKFQYYKKYGRATMENLLTEDEKKDIKVYTTTYTASAYIENTGNGTFKLRSLPVEAQVAPVNGIVTDDINKDGFEDIVMIGNDYGNEIFTGKHDAFTGAVLINDRGAGFKNLSLRTRGFKVEGDGKALGKIVTPKGVVFAATQNRDSLKLFAASSSQIFTPNLDDAYAEIEMDNGSKQRVEFYYGSGYLSQSTRKIAIGPKVRSMKIYNTKGDVRVETISSLASK